MEEKPLVEGCWGCGGLLTWSEPSDMRFSNRRDNNFYSAVHMLCTCLDECETFLGL